MKSLMSVNYKFMSISPKRLIELVNSSKYVKGLEVCIDFKKEEEQLYLDNLIFELKKNNLILQIHGQIELECDKQIEYFKKLEQYSDYLEYPIVVTLHSIYDDDKNKSLFKTLEYISSLIKNVDNNKIIICLENLNDCRKLDRLNKKEIRDIVLNDELLYFTYDIGHEIADYGKIIDLDRYMFEDIRNVHIHSVDNMGNDHIPIYKEDRHWKDIIKGIEFLIVNKYSYNIVYEYGLEYCEGKTIEDKIMSYIKSIDLVSEKYSY